MFLFYSFLETLAEEDMDQHDIFRRSTSSRAKIEALVTLLPPKLFFLLPTNLGIYLAL